MFVKVIVFLLVCQQLVEGQLVRILNDVGQLAFLPKSSLISTSAAELLNKMGLDFKTTEVCVSPNILSIVDPKLDAKDIMEGVLPCNNPYRRVCPILYGDSLEFPQCDTSASSGCLGICVFDPALPTYTCATYDMFSNSKQINDVRSYCTGNPTDSYCYYVSNISGETVFTPCEIPSDCPRFCCVGKDRYCIPKTGKVITMGGKIIYPNSDVGK